MGNFLYGEKEALILMSGDPEKSAKNEQERKLKKKSPWQVWNWAVNASHSVSKTLKLKNLITQTQVVTQMVKQINSSL